MYNITYFKDILVSKSGGKPLAKVPNFYSLLYQAIIDMKKWVDLPSALRSSQLTTPIYSDIYRYLLPPDMSLGGIVAVRPAVKDSNIPDYVRQGSKQFNLNKKYGIVDRLSIESKDGLQYLLMNAETTNSALISGFDSLTYAAALGVSSNLELDYLQKISGAASLSFDAGIGSLNGIENGVDYINLADKNDFLLEVYLPSVSNLSEITGIKISVGQSNANYFSGATNKDFFGNNLKAGFNLIRVPKKAFSVAVGSPTWNGIQYMRAEILGTLTQAIAGIKLDSFVAQYGALYEIDYYSNYHFQNSAGSRTERPTSDNDYILVQDDELDLLLHFFIEILATDLKQQGANIDIQIYGGNTKMAALENFKLKYPSQRILETTQYAASPRIN